MERKFIVVRELSFLLALLCCSDALESPSFTVVHSEADVEIRLYKELLWMSAQVRDATSFEKSTEEGFHRLYQYIHGANANSTRLMITAPILTTMAQAPRGSNYTVRLYVPEKHEGAPPQPYAELDLHLDQWKTHCIAVRRFSGFAKDDNINKEKEALVSSLDKILDGKNAVLGDNSSYAIAQYNASSHLSGRLNEVWINVSAPGGCPSN
ncbi:hypothetical protein RJ639_039481 [Escallonia herrerae]|uniref:SOUL heme-binding protein n=1 Tax=Escallonia herrerae TaxID=1293975 RepID=A0AA89B6F2_9ASTE|nr:hypothetical protein RJ639_039481 [Escallonia herrerae]